MTRGWLSRVVKQGFKVSLTTQDRIGQAGQRLSEGWRDMVEEARAEHAANGPADPRKRPKRSALAQRASAWNGRRSRPRAVMRRADLV